MLACFFGISVPVFQQPLNDFFPLIALDNNFSVFCRSAGTTITFKFFPEIFEILIFTNEICDQRYCLPGSVLGIQPDSELLLCRQGCSDVFAFLSKRKIGIGTKDISPACWFIFFAHV